MSDNQVEVDPVSLPEAAVEAESADTESATVEVAENETTEAEVEAAPAEDAQKAEESAPADEAVEAESEAASKSEEGAEEAPVSSSKLVLSETHFNDFPIGDDVKKALESMGYTNPTDVQESVIEAALAKKDLVVQAKTGSGKTLGFGLPLVERYEPGSAEPGRPKAVILAPTRELAHQVAGELRRVADAKGTKIFAVYGGVPLSRQIGALKAGVDILVATPGRLLDHLRRKNMTMEAVEVVVLDEADEMLSMGFWDDVTDLLDMCPESRQVMLFSATLPYQIAKAAAQYLKDPVRVDVSGDVLTVDGIKNCICHVVPDLPKPRQLLYLMEEEEPGSAIVFCNTRNETEVIAKYLCQNGLIAEAISGSFKQRERERVMSRIMGGELRFMVATDIAARGIDIDHLSHVYNYSLPEFSEVYLHRVGRTGRAGRSGTAISLVDGKGLGTYTVLERQFGVKFEEVQLPKEEDVLRKRSVRIMKDLLEKASVAETSQHQGVAEEILKSDEASTMVAFLLKSYFGKQAQEATKSETKSKSGGRQEEPRRDEEGGEDGQKRRRRRRRRRGRDRDRGEQRAEGGNESRGGGRQSRGDGNQDGGESRQAPVKVEEGMRCLRVNIGFDDGFKGRGAVAKKITSLAGLNDGIVSEVESKRHHAVLKTTPEVAELLVERVDGAQIGKKILSVSLSN
ncbi:MAG: DEAD/DEAH box helicase [Myxococcota bacterium]|nr:DEAD/DEAH box helicase [Myxococcota bacterium]